MLLIQCMWVRSEMIRDADSHRVVDNDMYVGQTTAKLIGGVGAGYNMMSVDMNMAGQQSLMMNPADCVCHCLSLCLSVCLFVCLSLCVACSSNLTAGHFQATLSILLCSG